MGSTDRPDAPDPPTATPVQHPSVPHDVMERVLVFAPTGRDAPLITDALRRAGFGATQCQSIQQLCDELQTGAGVAFVAEEALATDAIACLTDAIRKQPPWSDLPVIVMTSGGKTTQYSEKTVKRLEAGNLTLLERPLRILTLISAVHAALRARRRQYQVRQLLDQQQEAVRQRDQFLAMLGHELRNPLAAIRTAVEVIGECEENDQELLTQHTQIIRRQSTNLSRLVDDLLDVARATAGKIVLNRQRLDLRDLTQRAIDGVKLAVGAQRHEITVETPAQPAVVFGDPVRLEQILANLLTNAIKYTPPGGKISIRVLREEHHARIRVADTGEGIPPQMLPRIFEPFVQVDQNIDRSRGGLGLGLPLVNLLVKMHGGTVEAFSQGSGAGSEFVVTLPLARPGPPPARSHPEARPTATVSRRVLIVEDGADARAAMRALVRMWGHDVVVAEDGPSGVERAREFRPEIALLDIGLPGLDGYQVAKAVRDSLGQDVCLIALTGYGQAEDRHRARAAGFDAHLVKPVEPPRLKRILADPSVCKNEDREGV